ncbi:MAG: hypothetical protein WBM71_14715 [Sedimenticolaceae bacterium]
MNEDGENPSNGSESADITAIQNAVLQYMKRHPESCDTAIGVARWWLPRSGIETGVEQVRTALANLVRRGQLDAVVLPGGETHYVAAGRGVGRSK